MGTRTSVDELKLRRLLRILNATRCFLTLIAGVITVAAGFSTLAHLVGQPAKAMGSLSESVVFLIAATAFLLFAPRAVKRAMSDLVTQMPELPEEAKTRFPETDLAFKVAEPVPVEGRLISLEFSKCLVHIEGDLLGNVEVSFRSSPAVPVEVLSNHLRLRVPGHDGLLATVAWAGDDRTKALTFSLADLAPLDVENVSAWERETALAVTAIEIWWKDSGMRRVATVPCSHRSEG